jgi:hypothetical protein
MPNRPFPSIKTNFLRESRAERPHPVASSHFEVERTKMTPLPAERNVDIQSDLAVRRDGHD